MKSFITVCSDTVIIIIISIVHIMSHHYTQIHFVSNKSVSEYLTASKCILVVKKLIEFRPSRSSISKNRVGIRNFVYVFMQWICSVPCVTFAHRIRNDGFNLHI